MAEDKDLKNLMEELEENGQKVSDINILFLDMSSNCTGYCVASVNFTNKSAKFIKAGALWLDKHVKNQEKYHYLFKTITDYFYIVDSIDYCVAEAYMINSKKVMGSHVGPELHGALQVALSEVGVTYNNILPQTWRSELGIKPIVTYNNKNKKTRDYKTPTENYVNSKISNIPSTVTSNMTNKARKTPNDLYDSIAIGMGFLHKLGITNWDTSNVEIQPDVISQ